MPNLVGLWHQAASASALQATLERQLAAVQCGFRPLRTHRMSAATWAAALLDNGLLENGEQPGRSRDGRYSVLLDGEIYNLEELAERYRLQADAPARGAAAGCADLLATRGLEIVELFNGAFALVVWDSREQQLHLIVDRHGARPLFYRQSQGSVVFATELKGVIAASAGEARLDPVAVCEQLVYGVHFRGRTWLAGCERVQPAVIVTIGERGLSSRRYWRYEYDYSGRTLDQESYATGFAVLLDRAVERRMRGTKRIGIFLSGGYDSRSVAASVRPHHLPIPAFTFGEPQSRDMQIAPALAQRLGLAHHALPPRKPYLFPNAAAIVWRTEGLLPFSTATSVQFHELMTQHVDIFLTGFLAEFSGSHTWPALLAARKRRAIVDAIYGRFVAPRAARARSVLRPEVFAAAFDELRARFFQSFEEIANEHAMDVADAWNFTCLQPGGSFQAPAVDRHRLEMRAPHTDAELVDFLMTIPPLARIEQRVYKRMIATAFPAVRDIPCANSMRPIEPRFWLEYPKMVTRFAARKVAEPVRRLIGKEDRLGRELSDLDADFRAEPALRTEVLEPLVQQRWLDDCVFSLPAVAELTQAHFAGRADAAAVLAQVASLGLAWRMLVRGEVDDVPAEYRS
jgi:asparagine synthase (glutamine-hydrolysing)